MNTYTPITLDEFTTTMMEKGFGKFDYPRAREVVFSRELDSRFSIIIFSSITPCNGVSRERGSDAIRVAMYDTENSCVIKLGKRVNRVGTPEDVISRTLERARDVYRHWKSNRCPKCNSPMQPRTRRHDKKKFLGCINFPDCRGTKEME